MSVPNTSTSVAAGDFSWLLNRFATETDGVREAITVSADGLLMAMSRNLDRTSGDRLAAITSGISSLANGASRCYDYGAAVKVIIELEGGYLLVSAISLGATLGVIATKQANLGNIAYEMALFTGRAGNVLTPQLVSELRTSLEALA